VRRVPVTAHHQALELSHCEACPIHHTSHKFSRSLPSEPIHAGQLPETLPPVTTSEVLLNLFMLANYLTPYHLSLLVPNVMSLLHPALTLDLVLSVLPPLSFGIQYPSKYAQLQP